MNQLLPNSETGFLESTSNYGTNFTSEKKVKLLEEADKYRKETGKWPDLGSLCEMVGIQPITFDRHLKQDPKFRDAWKNLMLGGKYKLESLMFDLSSKNPMYMFGWLRKHFPEEYNPDHNVNVNVNTQETAKLIDTATVYEAELVD